MGYGAWNADITGSTVFPTGSSTPVTMAVVAAAALAGGGGSGSAGQRGSIWNTGTGAPGTIAGSLAGDEYLDTATGNVYSYSGSAWLLAGNIKGATGAAGATGATGANGAAGIRGSIWNNGTGAPGVISGSLAGDEYFDTASGNVYTYNGSSWTLIANIKGPAGPAGSGGMGSGTRGSLWNTGTGAPGTISGSLAGDQYLDTATGNVYSYSGTAWTLSGNIRGATGATGATGAAGAAGAAGATGATGTRGSIWSNGNGAPGTIAGSLAGDEYLNTATGDVYQYSGTAWTLTGNIKGAPGSGAAYSIGGLSTGVAFAVTDYIGMNIGGTDEKVTVQGFLNATSTNYRARANGCKCDGMRLFDVATTAGSAVITSASYSFTSADVGKIMGIVNSQNYAVSDITGIYPGPGASQSISGTAVNGALIGTILSVSGGAATLSVAATLAATNCYAQFGTDDSTALNALITAVGASTTPTKRGTVILEGITIASNPIFVEVNYVSIQGAGQYSTALVYISTSDQVHPTITNNYSYSSTTVPQTIGNQFSEFEIDNSLTTNISSANVGAKCLAMPYSQDLRLFDMWFHDSLGSTVSVDCNINCVISRCKFDNTGRGMTKNTVGCYGIGNSVNGIAGESWIITDCIFTNPGHYSIGFEAQSAAQPPNNSFALVKGNIFESGVRASLSGSGGGFLDSGGTNLVVQDNLFIGPLVSTGINTANIFAAIAIYKSSLGGTLAGSKGRIEGNKIIGHTQGVFLNATGGGSTTTYPVIEYLIKNNEITYTLAWGILCKGLSGVPFNSIVIEHNFVGYAATNGIYVFDSATTGTINNLSIRFNTIKNSAQLSGQTAQTGSAIQIGAGTYAGLKITDNWAYDDQATKTQKYGLYFNPTAATGVDISRNDFTGNATGIIDIVNAATSGQMLDNVGYNPVGQAALSLTSGTAYVAGLTRETVYLQGAGITITKGSTALLSGVSQASVDLLPGESFTPTFSSLSSQFTDKH